MNGLEFEMSNLSLIFWNQLRVWVDQFFGEDRHSLCEKVCKILKDLKFSNESKKNVKPEEIPVSIIVSSSNMHTQDLLQICVFS